MNFLTIILALIILIFSFTEILVFNEEVLLALCFIAFAFFAYSKLNNTISSFFKDNALKLENELLYSLVLKSEKIIIQFNDSSHSRKLQNSNLLLESLALFSISSFINNFFSNFINISLSKIHNSFKDISLLNENSIISTQRKKLRILNTNVIPLVISRKYDYLLQSFLPLFLTKK